MNHHIGRQSVLSRSVFHSYLPVVLLLLMITVTFACGTDAGTRHQPLMIPITQLGFGRARTDGTYVVWSVGRGTGGQREPGILAITLPDQQPNPVKTGLRFPPFLDVDQGIVVWFEGSPDCPSCTDALHAKDLKTGREFVVAEGGSGSTDPPAISDNWVVWLSSQSLMARDITTMAKPVTLATSQGCQLHTPVVDGNRVAWAEEMVLGPHACGHQRLLTKRIGETQPTVVAYKVSEFDIGGDVVVYVDAEFKLVALNLVTHERRILHRPNIVSGFVYQSPSSPTTDGHYVFWVQSAEQDSAAGQSRKELWGYDLLTENLFPVFSEGFNVSPDANGGSLIWQQWDADGTATLHITTVADLPR